MDTVQITGIKLAERKIQSIKLIRSFLTETPGGGTMGLREAKDLVDNFERGIPFPKMWIYQTLNNDFKAQFEYDESPPLRLFRIGLEIEADDQAGPMSPKKGVVIVLSTSEATARVVALDKMVAEHGRKARVAAADEITTFKNNTILASYTV